MGALAPWDSILSSFPARFLLLLATLGLYALGELRAAGRATPAAPAQLRPKHDAAAAAAGPRYAYGLTMARPRSFWQRGLWTNASEQVNRALHSVCSLRNTRPAHDIVVLLNNWPPGTAALFRQAGATRVIETTWDAYAHLLTAHTDDPNRKRNMPVTCFKLLFWNLTEYAEVVHFDADVLWLGENSDYVFGHPNATGVEMVATWELRPQPDWQFSFNSHLMRLTPSAERFESLVRRMETGDWRPYTNGEQDILNSEFEDEAGYFFGGERDPHGGRGFAPVESARVISNEIGILRLPQHLHGNPYEWNWRTGVPIPIPNCVTYNLAD